MRSQFKVQTEIWASSLLAFLLRVVWKIMDCLFFLTGKPRFHDPSISRLHPKGKQKANIS